MKSMQSYQVHKRDIKLTLNEEPVSQAKDMTSNFSDMASQAWNGFNKQSGSFADEHSTL